MSYRKKPSGKEYKQLVDQYKKANHQGRLQLANEHGISYGTLRNWVSEGDCLLYTSPSPRD